MNHDHNVDRTSQASARDGGVDSDSVTVVSVNPQNLKGELVNSVSGESESKSPGEPCKLREAHSAVGLTLSVGGVVVSVPAQMQTEVGWCAAEVVRAGVNDNLYCCERCRARCRRVRFET